MIRLSSLVQRQMSALAVLLVTSLFYSGSLTAAPVKVAFTGDQGAGEGARAVLSLIASEGADLLLIQGDLGYDDGKASIWEENLTQALGANFPVLTLVGNHENFEWPLYKPLIQQRIDRVDGLSCSGDTGVKAVCRYENIEIVQVAPGIDEVEGVDGQANYTDFITSSFAESTAPWRICAWHKNQNKMQTGQKSDATGWGVYDACLDAGAMIAIAHEHAYSRSYLLSDFKDQTIVHKNSDMTLEPGKSFAFVSGLGGHEVRPQVQGGDWWASIYTASQGATHGALFCTFEETTADCYFKAIDGAVPDQFTLKTRLGSVSEPVTMAPVVAELGTPEVAERTAAPINSAEQNAVAETEVAAQSVSESVVETESFPPPESDLVSGESAQSGPLTVVSSPDVATGNTVPSPIDSETDANTAQAGSGGSAGGDVGSGSISLFLLLAMMARIGLLGFAGFSNTGKRLRDLPFSD